MRRLVGMLRDDSVRPDFAPQPSMRSLDVLLGTVRESGLPVDLVVEGTAVELAPGVDLAAYRVVQEALTNALKYAGPARACVTVRWKRGELEKLPIRDESVDVALLSQALHHAQSPDRAVAEATRITVPGGRVLLLDLRAHAEDWVRNKLGDRRLGFRDEELERLLTTAGLRDVRIGVGARKAGDPFTVLVASGTKPRPIREKRSRRNP